ncbi:MAG: efflux RND transporter periplasmic adaptor subunit [Chloroflexota bacterium]
MRSQLLNIGKQAMGRRVSVLAALAVVALLLLAVPLSIAAMSKDENPGEATPQGATAIAIKVAPVAEGSIASHLSYSGDVKAVTQVAVVPKGSGRIEEILVEVGSRVKKGDVLAKLDAESLQAQVAQARAALAAAEARYASMERGPRSEQVGQAAAALEQAQARRDAVVKGARESDLAAAQSAVEQARAGLANAQAAYERVKKGATQAELAAAKAAVDQSELAIKAAQANLDDLKAGPKDHELWAAQQAVEQARAALDAANDQVQIWKGESTDAEKRMSGATSASQAETGRQAAQTALDSAVARLNYLKGRPYPHELQAAETALYTALANYESSKARLEQLQRGATEEDIQQAESAVKTAEAVLVGAEARLKALEEGATEEEKRQAEAAVAQASQAYQMAVKPYLDEDLAQGRASVEQARAALELAELALKESEVRSPIDGVVAEKHGEIGALVSPATPIVTIVSEGVEIALGVEESQIGQIEEGQRAEIETAAYPGEQILAKVAKVSPTADARTRTFQVKVRPEIDGGKLRPGMFAQVKIVTGEKERALLVPKEAVLVRDGRSVVYVVNGDVVEMREVELGLSQNGSVELVSGVVAGEEVVVAGQNELRDGDKVEKK